MPDLEAHSVDRSDRSMAKLEFSPQLPHLQYRLLLLPRHCHRPPAGRAALDFARPARTEVRMKVPSSLRQHANALADRNAGYAQVTDRN
jgi:hypothetical protein